METKLLARRRDRLLHELTELGDTATLRGLCPTLAVTDVSWSADADAQTPLHNYEYLRVAFELTPADDEPLAGAALAGYLHAATDTYAYRGAAIVMLHATGRLPTHTRMYLPDWSPAMRLCHVLWNVTDMIRRPPARSVIAWPPALPTTSLDALLVTLAHHPAPALLDAKLERLVADLTSCTCKVRACTGTGTGTCTGGNGAEIASACNVAEDSEPASDEPARIL